jgi:hypothetical protein
MLAAATGRSVPARKTARWSAELGVDDDGARASGHRAASAWSAASAALGLVRRLSAMKLTSWPTFISTPFISPSSLATSSAVRIANCVVELGPPLGRRATPRTVAAAKRAVLRADSSTPADRLKRLVSGDRGRVPRLTTPPARPPGGDRRRSTELDVRPHLTGATGDGSRSGLVGDRTPSTRRS